MRRFVPLFNLFLLGLLLWGMPIYVSATQILIAQSKGAQSDLYTQAEALFEDEKYDEVIRLLSGPANAEPGNFGVNILLAHAELKQCERLKEAGDQSYKTLVYSPYNRSQVLHRIDKNHPEPYHIAARALMINERPQKAYQTIRKALYFRPEDPEYLTTLGDIQMARVKHDRTANQHDVRIWRADAEDAYKKALNATGDGPGSEKLKKEIERKLKQL